MARFREGKPSFNRGRESRFGGGKDRDFRDSERRPLQMHEVTCDKCGKQCEVPFRPKGDKPVYCSDCFEKPGRPARREFSERPSYSPDKLDEINVKLDKIMKALKL